MRKTLLIMAVGVGVAIAFGTIANAAMPKVEFGIVKVSDPNSAAELQMDKSTKASGTVWSVEAGIESFTVTSGETTTITVPTKVNVKAVFGELANTSAGRTLPIMVGFTSAETGVGSAFKTGSTPVLPPQFQIADSKGRLLQAGSFSYG